jgi:Orsellinic acid/F9775 biosynthesis cluster protein D
VNVLIVEIEESMVNDNDADVEMEEGECSINMPLMIDSLYNVIVCEECGIGLPFEWAVSHLKENHGIKVEIVDVMRHLDLMRPSMTLKEAKEWIKNVWMGKAMQNVPIHQGFACNHCQYCTRDMKLMRKHFSNEHRGLKASENSQECTIQMPFRAELRKYIQVDEFDNEMMREDDEDDEEGWNKTLEEEFEESIGRINISKNNEHDDLRLMGAFIARTRWDIAVKDMDRKTLIEMAAAPSIKDKLHKIILCGRRYIQQCCERITNGNIMIRRLLMSVGYIQGYLSV